MIRLLMVLLFLMDSLSASDPCDPWLIMKPLSQFTCLAALREPLDRTPDDQHLLGLALVSYAFLTLPLSDKMLAIDQGDWLHLAKQLRDRRVAARHGAESASLAESIPEVLIQVLEGQTAAAIAALDRWPEVATDARARALRMAATGDWRQSTTPPLTPFEAWARVWAFRGHGYDRNAEIEEAMNTDGLPGRMKRFVWGDGTHLWRRLVGDTAFMLRSYAITNFEAQALLTELAQAAGLSVIDLDREGLVQAIDSWASSLHNHGVIDARAAAVAYKICDHFAAAEHGVMDGNHHRLFGLGDVARMNREWLYAASVKRLGEVCTWNKEEGEERDFLQCFREIVPDSLLRARLELRDYALTDPPSRGNFPPVSQSALDDLANRIEAEWSRPNRHGDGVILKALGALADRRHARVGELVEQILRLANVAGPNFLGRDQVIRLAEASRFLPEFPARLITLIDACVVQDPGNAWLHEHQRLHRVGHPRLDPDPTCKPQATWIDTTVNHEQCPWSSSPRVRGQNFWVHWQGWLQVPVAGTYVMAIDVDDGARLEVGPLVIDAWFTNDSNRFMSRGSLSSGWQRLDLGYFQEGGGTRMKLLWTPPGGTGLVPVPAERLAHGTDHQPGLAAAYWWCSTESVVQLLPDDADRAWLRERPWASGSWSRVGMALAQNSRFTEALPWLDAAGHSLDWTSVLRNLAIFHAAPERHAEALAQIANSGTMRWSWSNYGSNVSDVSEQIIMGGWSEETLSLAKGTKWYENPDIHQRFVLSRIALAAGDFTVASTQLSGLFSTNSTDALYWWYDYVLFRMEGVALSRMLGGPEPDLETIKEDLKQHDLAGMPHFTKSWQYLSGVTPWSVLATKLATDHNKESRALAWYFRGLQCLAEHQWAEARTAFAASAGSGSSWWPSITSKALLTWLDHQNADTLATRPAGRPIPLPPSEKTGVNNF